MKHLLFAVAAALALICAPAMAQTHTDKNGTVIPGQAPIYLYVPLGYQQISSSSLSSATSLTVPAGSTLAFICVETAGVRYRDDGTAPTSSVGQPWIPASATLPNCAPYAGSLSAVQFIAISGGSPTIDVLYYKAQ